MIISKANVSKQLWR